MFTNLEVRSVPLRLRIGIGFALSSLLVTGATTNQHNTNQTQNAGIGQSYFNPSLAGGNLESQADWPFDGDVAAIIPQQDQVQEEQQVSPTTVVTMTTPRPQQPTTATRRLATPPPVSGGFHGDYALDAMTTNTPDWQCIRVHESGDRYGIQSGAYGFITSTAEAYFGTANAGSVPPAIQDATALKIFHANGLHFAGAWSTAAACGLR